MSRIGEESRRTNSASTDIESRTSGSRDEPSPVRVRAVDDAPLGVSHTPSATGLIASRRSLCAGEREDRKSPWSWGS
jgi:hypothetical protein